MLGTIAIFQSLDSNSVGLVISGIAVCTYICGPAITALTKTYFVHRSQRFGSGRIEIFLLAQAIPAAAGALIACFLVPFFITGLSGLSLLMIATSICFSTNATLLAELEFQDKFYVVSIIRVATSLAVLAVRLIAASSGMLEWFVASFMLEQLLLFVLAGVVLFATASPEHTTAHHESLFVGTRRAIADALRITPTEYVAGLPLRVPILLFGLLSLHREAALYVAASRIPDAMTASGLVIFNVFRPRIYKSLAELGGRADGLGRIVGRFFLFYCVACLVVAAGSWAGVAILFGPQYEDSKYAAAIYALVPPLVLLGVIQEPYLIVNRLFAIGFWKVSVASVATAACVWFAIELAGGQGAFGTLAAVVAVVLGVSCQSLFLNLVWRETRPLLLALVGLLSLSWWQSKARSGSAG